MEKKKTSIDVSFDLPALTRHIYLASCIKPVPACLQMGRPGSASLDQTRANLASIAHMLQDKQGLQGHAKASKAYLAGQLRLTWTHAGDSPLLDSSFLFTCAQSAECDSMWSNSTDSGDDVLQQGNLQAAMGQEALQVNVQLLPGTLHKLTTTVVFERHHPASSALPHFVCYPCCTEVARLP